MDFFSNLSTSPVRRCKFILGFYAILKDATEDKSGHVLYSLFGFIPEGKGTLQQVSPITEGPLLSIFMREENRSTRRKIPQSQIEIDKTQTTGAPT